MANHTLLDAINEIFKRVNNIQGDAAALTSLTDSARQHEIDVSIQVINEGIDELYSSSPVSLPSQQEQGTITLASGMRNYTLATDLIELHFPLIDKTNNNYIWKYPGDYNDLLLLDPEQDDTGLPWWGVISPIDGTLFVNVAPTSAEAGLIYTYQYQKDLGMSALTDTVPFNNEVFRAMVPAWVQLYKRELRNEFDQSLYGMSIGRAARALSEVEPNSSYSPRRTGGWL